MGPNRTEVSPLRERKKASTRESLRTTAIKLFADRGFAAVSVDEIASRAQVSRSTFFRYFGSKEAVLFNEIDETGDTFLTELRSRPLEESPWEAFEEALIVTSTAAQSRRTPDEQLAVSLLIQNDPALVGRRLEEQIRWTELTARAFAARAGRQTPELEDRLAAATCMAIADELGRLWRADHTLDQVALIREGFSVVRKAR